MEEFLLISRVELVHHSDHLYNYTIWSWIYSNIGNNLSDLALDLAAQPIRDTVLFAQQLMQGGLRHRLNEGA